ncbi:hypothetical protein [Nesterenkonia rhizosphaerae]|uniref:Uncharacterized protein n=1 Tax=Nesterenkonia rhizosphaerae TaxID=1348272 RepID=A0ABP9G1V4_9MICC
MSKTGGGRGTNQHKIKGTSQAKITSDAAGSESSVVLAAKPQYYGQDKGYSVATDAVNAVRKKLDQDPGVSDIQATAHPEDGVVNVTATHHAGTSASADLEVRADWPDDMGGPHIKLTTARSDMEAPGFTEERIPLTSEWTRALDQRLESALNPPAPEPATTPEHSGFDGDDDDEDEEEWACGMTFDHDQVITYEDETMRQWMCKRCGAEGWDEFDEAETPEPS